MSNKTRVGLTNSRQCPLLILPGAPPRSILAMGENESSHAPLLQEIPTHGNTCIFRCQTKPTVHLLTTIGFAITGRDHAVAAGVSPSQRRHAFSTLLAAFQVALSRWTGAEDVVVGTPVANRTKAEISVRRWDIFAGVVPCGSRWKQNELFLRSIYE